MSLRKSKPLFITIAILLFWQSQLAQTPADLSKTSTAITLKTDIIERKRPANVYNYCDADGDGFIQLNIAQITQEVLENNGLGNNDNEAVLISTETGRIIKIDNPSTAGDVNSLCILGWALTDVAVDPDGIMYANRFTSIFKFVPNSCNYETIIDYPFGTFVNAMSFDTAGNLYYGFGDRSEVLRYDSGGGTSPYVWHDFGTGGAGGDFVMLNGKLYVAWHDNSKDYLYEVTVDSNFNYVSHVNLGITKEETYGLASELGKLYGVTPNELYRIDIETFSFETIIENNGAYGAWWGAAGLHEGVELVASAHLSNNDANINANPMPESWINTREGGQIIYVRIEDINSGNYDIIAVTINVYKTPQISEPNDLLHCSEETTSIFNLTEVEDELLSTVTQGVQVGYYLTNAEAHDGINAISSLYQSLFRQQAIHVRVQNKTDSCYAVTDFLIRTEPYPMIAPQVANESERSLTNCYINNMDQGYFKLNEMLEEIIPNDNVTFDIEYYLTYEDAEEGINSIYSIYFGSLGLVEEIFVKVTNPENCSSISNFFIDGDCVLSTEYISEIRFPRFFTPNFDSYHDYWNLTGMSDALRRGSVVQIFDRFGKILYSFIPADTRGWDGTYNNNPMPSSDYWFKIKTPIGQEFTGHFTLKR